MKHGELEPSFLSVLENSRPQQYYTNALPAKGQLKPFEHSEH